MIGATIFHYKSLSKLGAAATGNLPVQNHEVSGLSGR